MPPETFVGSWRSVTPSLEFIRLSVHSKSSEQGALAGRLTLSGVAWEGSGRIDGDSLRLDVTITGASGATRPLVIRMTAPGTLRAQLRYDGAQPLDLTLVPDR